MSTVADNVRRVRERMAAAARRAGRDPAGVRLVVVTKQRPIEAIIEALAAGETDIGENRAQEVRDKIPALLGALGAGARPRVHFIGHLQSNKAKYIIPFCDCVHSVDSVSVGEALDRAAAAAGRDAVDVLVQANVSGEETKTGLEVSALEGALRGLARFERLRVRGLMTMAPFDADCGAARPVFRGLREARDRLAALDIPRVALDELSMGMTNDFEVAIEEGATLVRVGTAIFEGL